MSEQTEVIDKKNIVIRFSGDSGDGMQLTGQQFSDAAALFGNGVSTFPDYPAEIRAVGCRCRFGGSPLSESHLVVAAGRGAVLSAGWYAG